MVPKLTLQHLYIYVASCHIYIYMYMALDRSAATFWLKISFLAQFYSRNGPPKKCTKIWCIFSFPSNLLYFPKKVQKRWFSFETAQDVGSRLVSRHTYIWLYIYICAHLPFCLLKTQLKLGIQASLVVFAFLCPSSILRQFFAKMWGLWVGIPVRFFRGFGLEAFCIS